MAAGQEQHVKNLVAWEKSWDAYARGNVVTESAALLICSFLLKTIAATGVGLDDHNSSDEEHDQHDLDIPALKLDAPVFAQLSNPYFSRDGKEEDAQKEGEYGEEIREEQAQEAPRI